MLKSIRAAAFSLALPLAALVTGLSTIPSAQAQQPKEALPAPVPPQIFTAKKVSISDAGGDNNGLYHGGPDRLYNEFYAALKTWGRYELASSPAAADLVLEVSFSNPFIGEDMLGGGGTQVSNYNFTDPHFRLSSWIPPRMCRSGHSPHTLNARACKATAIRTSITPSPYS